MKRKNKRTLRKLRKREKALRKLVFKMMGIVAPYLWNK